MRKVHKQMLEAFKSGKQATNAAHKVYHENGESFYQLHNTIIVKKDKEGRLFASNGGWNTPTTRAALRAFGFNPDEVCKTLLRQESFSF